jgi:hypothetical protein
MVKRILAALALLAFAVPALAQTPPDVGTYTPRTATYKTDGTANILGDGSNDKGGVAPAFSTIPEPTDPSPTVPAGWIVGTNISYCLTTVGGGCGEKKARFAAAWTHFLYDDPIRNYGQPGAAHCHEFFGNQNANAYSTRASLRLRTSGAGPGGPANATAYWQPCVLKTIGGKVYAIPSDTNVLYYVEEVQSGTSIIDKLQPLHLKLRFVTGMNMDDPNDCAAKNEIDVANGGAGTSCTVTPGRYSYKSNGFVGHQCVLANGTIAPTSAGLSEAKSFRLTTGTADADDPWYVGGVHTCVDGSQILSYGRAPECWDGWNVWSPGGYKHFRHMVDDSVTGLPVCPNGWYLVPSYERKTYHRTRGWDDYKTWSLASDAMMSAKLTALGTPRTVLPGESDHDDWMNGWNTTTLNTWLSFCMGIGSNVPHLCNYSTISATERLITDSAAPDGSRNPQVGGNPVDPNDATTLRLVDTTRQSTHPMKGM